MISVRFVFYTIVIGIVASRNKLSIIHKSQLIINIVDEDCLYKLERQEILSPS